MKRILLLISILMFLVSCKETYSLFISEEYLDIEINIGEELKLPFEISSNATILSYSSNNEIAIIDEVTVKGISAGECELTIRLDEDASQNYQIKVRVIDQYFINSDILKYNIKIGSSAKLVYEATIDEDVNIEIEDPSICSIEDGYINALNEGGTKVKISLKNASDKFIEILVYVLPLYTEYYRFNTNLFKENSIEIIKKETNKKVVIDETNKEAFINNLSLIYYIDSDEDYSDFELLYTINFGENELKVYQNNFFIFNNKKMLIISLDYYDEDIENFDFLDEYQYTENVDSGWFPWV